MTRLALLTLLTVLLILPQAEAGRLTFGFQFLYERKHKHMLKHLFPLTTTLRPPTRDPSYYSFLLKQPILIWR
ncbi:hypothetical protein QR680_015357 [Steinernema hermaphroditum]|uniref:Uncharacterized protein n=1 Tax=Steinernema hermaphroditum TaxID=289476 RepID=A0AA39H7E8_9BILA|nr:hypothetical protein QR680_015357 [Steinernema hermaphroditum]